ncbi:sporulation membrane protein YtaF [Microaerobacter geothermalis]|uniref:sporulation membrane protein YtaF n=1 Tax=Microaerobacter geothermalis TaxID=674972 RepID=UPI001F3B4F81|nr:sporulation membrane protein YtaF [Microaerobacter geothermalis]MCF6092970.1 sporulation membrane protein YtaF [Microaerobacter geothermalis]
MLNFLSLLILSFAVSLDGLGVGVTYGLRKVNIPLRSIFIIVLCSAFVMVLSMQLGFFIYRFFDPSLAKMIGAVILILIGLWAIYNMYRGQREQEELYAPSPILSIEIKTLGLMIQILKSPMKADMDRSGVISGIEATLLGIALSMDAFGAGIGAALIGFSPWISAPLIAGMSGIFLVSGMKIGYIFGNVKWMKRISYVPGMVLIIFGLFKML